MIMKKIFLIVLALLSSFSSVEGANKKGGKSTLNIATFNLRMDTSRDGENAWPHRSEMVKGLISFHDFDIFGTQEAFDYMLDEVLEVGGYAYIGVGRDDGISNGEHSAIFYKTERLKLLDSGNFWLSETPEIPSKGWDAKCCNRICTWGKFYDKQSRETFYLFNVHYDHQGQIARAESSRLLLNRVREIAGGKVKVFVTGDFNAVPTDEPIQILSSDGLLSDSYDVTKQLPYGTVTTFNGFKVDHHPQYRIDYIWVTDPDCVNKYGVINDIQNSRFPSDHFPVMIEVEF